MQVQVLQGASRRAEPSEDEAQATKHLILAGHL